MGCCFETKSLRPATADLDPTKHVNYVLGMVLGEDDFKQEFAYLAGRDRWLARDLIGFGTVRGLRLQVEMGGAGPRVSVDPGVALSPRGQLICVPTQQCAYLRDWVAKNAVEVTRRAGSPVGELPVYVVLCYRECPDDDVPIPGEPCRTEDQLTKPSRLRDDFCLELTFDPPRQREEAALRDFCRWLRAIDMTDASPESSPLQDFLDAIRQAAAPSLSSSPMSPPPGDYMSGSPPTWLHVHSADVCEYLRAAFRVWITELRPKWIERWYGCAPNSKEAVPAEDCVLIGEIRVTLIDDGAGNLTPTDAAAPTVHEDDRPFVVHLRMLQEWLLCARSPGSAGAVASPPSAPVPVAGNAVQNETAFNLAANPGSSPEYSRADHTHGTPDVPALDGDASGPVTANTVSRVRGVDVITSGAADGDILRFRTTPAGTVQWGPEPFPPIATPPSPGTAVIPENAFGMPASAGGSASFARADHTHGTPALPDFHFVGRAAEPYAIVAAGAFEFELDAGNPPQTRISTVSTYNGLVGLVRPGNDPTDTLYFNFKGFSTVGAEKRYIVKITPWWTKATKVGFTLYFDGFSRVDSQECFAVKVVGGAGTSAIRGNLMIEVSEIQG